MQRRDFLTGLGVGLGGLLGGAGLPFHPASAAPNDAAPNGVAPNDANGADFARFLATVRAEGAARGLPAAVLDAALGGLTPDPQVLALIAHQPEFTLPWPVYAGRAISPARIAAGRAARRRVAPLLPVLERDFGVPSAILLGIWGIESNYGATPGNFPAIRSLATLAYGSARPAFFRAELFAALEIIRRQGLSPATLAGSYAGALGQPQFMPSAYLRYAVDFNQDGSADIWHDEADVLASIANYLKDNGWTPGLAWGAPLAAGAPPAGSAASSGQTGPLPLAVWRARGVREAARLGSPEAKARLLLPRGGQKPFLVTANFDVIKEYNHSDFYALAVALLGERIAT